MPTVRSEIVSHLPGDTPADYCTNVVHHTIGSNPVFDPSVGYQSHADELRDLFSGRDPSHPEFNVYAGRTFTVKCYDLADAKPRPIRAQSVFTPSSPDAAGLFGPRQVAVVLSFYGDRNLPRQRGHIYIGPLYLTTMGPNPESNNLLSPLLALGHGLFDIGGENVAHVIHSERFGTDTVVHNYWVDNRWDTQRRRLQRASTRLTLAP